jgi:Nse1 non-SMC component of SMC5-6 complex
MTSLAQGMKMFNQRLLAEHCLSDLDARALWEEIREREYDMGEGTKSFEECIASSNDALKDAGLEIVGVSIPDHSSESNQSPQNRPTKRSLVRYYSIINRFPDDVAKKCFQNMFPPQQQAYVRLVFEKLVEGGPATRATVLNYKNLLNDNGRNSNQSSRLTMSQMTENTAEVPNEDGDDTSVLTKTVLTLPMVEDVLERLLAEKWLIMKLDGTGSRRSSNSSLVDIGPRSYMELSYLLVDEFGMEKDDLPQQIYHRL